MIRHVKHKSLKSYFNFKKYGNSNEKNLYFKNRNDYNKSYTKWMVYMIREIIEIDTDRRQNNILLEYDKEQFEIEYVKELHKIILRRKKTKKF